MQHVAELDIGKVDSEPIDPSGKHVVSCRLRLVRNVQGVRFPPAVSVDERWAVERIFSQAFNQMIGDASCEGFGGKYFPLEGMSLDIQTELERDGLLFEEPDASLLLSAGMGRNWP